MIELFPHSNNDGFTLVELVFTITLIAIVCAIGLISLNGFKSTDRFNSSVLEIRSILELAKSEAIKNQSRVAVNFTLGAGSAGTYTIFTDDGAVPGTYESATEKIIRQGHVEDDAKIVSANFTSAGTSTSTVFNPMGLALTFSGYVYFTNANGNFFKRVVVTSGGSTRIENSSNRNGPWSE